MVADRSGPGELGQLRGGVRAITLRLAERYVYVRSHHQFFCRDTRDFVPLEALNAAHAHEMPKGRHGRVSAAKALLESYQTSKVEGVTFEPGAKEIVTDGTATRLNLWVPPALQPAPGDVSWFLDHLAYIFDDEVAIGYVQNFLAHLVQQPAVKLKSTPLIIGGQGIGKSFIADAMAPLLGRSNVAYIGDGELLSPFNGWIENALLVVVPELYSGQRAEVMNRLKPYITDHRITINRKYAPTYSIDNRANFILLSNHEDAALLEPGDRRYFVHLSQAVPRERDYYNVLYQRLEVDAPALLHYFLHRDLTDFDPNAPPPVTTGKSRVMEDSRPNAIAYLAEAAESGALPFDKDLVSINGILDQLPPSRVAGMSHRRIADFLRGAGAEPLIGTKRVGSRNMRLWAIRNQGFWANAGESEIARHLLGGIADESR